MPQSKIATGKSRLRFWASIAIVAGTGLCLLALAAQATRGTGPVGSLSFPILFS